MPEANVDLVRRQFEAFERGGLDAVAEFWHPDIEWRAVEGAIDDSGVLSGRDAMRRYYEDWTEMVEDMHVDVGRVVHDSGETLVVVLHNSGRGRGSGAPITGRYTVVYTIRDGLVVRGREYETPEQAMQALRSSQPAA